MYSIILSREAKRFYERCGMADAKKLDRCFESLERHPRLGNNIKALKGRFAGSYRYRLGNLRVIYTINDQQITVFVITIAQRGGAYD